MNDVSLIAEMLGRALEGGLRGAAIGAVCGLIYYALRRMVGTKEGGRQDATDAMADPSSQLRHAEVAVVPDGPDGCVGCGRSLAVKVRGPKQIRKCVYCGLRAADNAECGAGS